MQRDIAQIGKGVIIRASAALTYPWKVKIGDYSWGSPLWICGPMQA